MNVLKVLFVLALGNAFILDIVQCECPDGWVVFGDSCYLFSHENISFVEAKHFCEHHGSHLVHVNSATENAFIKSFLRDLLPVRHLMGLMDEDIEGVWKWTDTDTITTFTDWQTSQPSDGRISNCGIFWMEMDFAWADEPCTNRKYQPICEKEVSQPTCPDGHVSFESSCYLFSHENVHFTEAENFCRQHKAHLVQVESSAENAFVKSYLRELKSADHWLGLTDEVIEDIWKWYESNTIPEFSDWNPGEPNQGRIADCASFHAAFDFRWADEPCSERMYQPICELNHL